MGAFRGLVSKILIKMVHVCTFKPCNVIYEL